MFETAGPETFKPHSQQDQQAPVEEHVAFDRLLFQRRETKRTLLAAQGGLPGDAKRRAGEAPRGPSKLAAHVPRRGSTPRCAYCAGPT
eukprot:7141577-Heterocapsa_arctica.AAC.1